MSHSNYVLEVNGSAYTLFPDAEKAVSVNEGVTLIPWMGDNSNMIDRYDVRGHLYSESEFGIGKTELDPEEARLQDELDKERYMFLSVDELEFEAYLEEEEKRFKSKMEPSGSYGQVGFSYGNSEEVAKPAAPASAVVEEVYIPDPKLAIPDGMKTPQTKKHYKILEKTAAFLSTQNLQTEILIRTKQKDNPQFQFLEPDNELNSFYKHVVSAIKRKVITVQSEPKPKPPAPAEPTEQQKQILAKQQQVQQMYLVQQQQMQQQKQQEYNRQVQAYQQQQGGNRGQWNKLGGEILHHAETKQGVGSSLAALSAYGAASDSDDTSEDEDTSNQDPSGSTLSNMINTMSKPIPVPAGTSPEVIQYLIMSGFVALPPPAPGLPQLLVPPAGYEGFAIPTAPPPPPPEEEVHLTEEPEDCGERPPSPSPEQKGIITKLAEYVVKNGDSFERKVQQKRDERFAFVNPGNEHFPYYQYLIQRFRNKRVKLNVAPIQIKKKSTQVRPTGKVDSSVFNEESSEGEEEEGKEELQGSGQDNPPEYTSPQTDNSNYTASQQTEQSLPHSQEQQQPVIIAPMIDNQSFPIEEEKQTPPPQQYHRLDVEPSSRTPIYTQETADRTPSPTQTPPFDRTQTPEVKTPPKQNSDAESVDSETKGRPLVQHFSDESGKEDRYDLDGRRSSEKTKSPVRDPSQNPSRTERTVSRIPSRTRSRSRSGTKRRERTRSSSRRRRRSRSHSRRRRSTSRSRSKRRRTRTPSVKRSRTKTKSYSRSPSRDDSERRKRDDERFRVREEELKRREDEIKKKEEMLKSKEETEQHEEGEISDSGKISRKSREISDSGSRRKHRKHKERGQSPRSPARHKKKKKERSRKRHDKSSDSDSRSSSTKKQKVETKEHRKRKTPPKKSDTDDWMSEKMKKLSKVELLKEIENKLEEKKKLRQKEKKEKHRDPSSERSSKKEKSKEEESKELTPDKEIEKTEPKKQEENGATANEDNTESKKDEEKRLAMVQELAEIEAKLQAKKLKKQADGESKKHKKSSEKINGHSEKSKKKKDKKESIKEKKS